MKKSTKFFILTTVVNIILSAITVFSTLLKEVRVVDIVTFYATAFGAGASLAAMVISMISRGTTKPPEEKTAGEDKP